MSVTTTVNRWEYVADGVQTVFAFTAYVDVASELQVYDNGTLLGSGYSISGLQTDTGGNVTFSVAPLSGHNILLLRVVALDQTSVLPSSGPFPAKTVEKMSDKLTRITQQLQETDKRALKLAVSSLYDNLLVPDPSTGKFLRWKDATQLENADITGQGAIGLPISFANGGTGVSAASADDLAKQLKLARWTRGATLTPSAGELALPDPITGNTYRVGIGNFSSISVPATNVNPVLILRFVSGGNVLTSGINFHLIGSQNRTTVIDDVSVFYWDSDHWIELVRIPGTEGSTKFWRGDGTWATPPSPVRGQLSGLGLANNGTDPTNDIDIAVGTACSDDAALANLETMDLGSSFTKQLDAAWAVGTNAGGRDTGAIADGTWHVFLIKRTDTGVVDVLFSLSATAPTMPTNYAKKRRIGSILRETGAIVGFVQEGDEFLRKASSLDVDATNPGTAAVTRTLKVPTGVKVVAIFNALFTGNSTNPIIYVSSLDQNDEAPSATAAPLANLGSSATNYTGGITQRVRTNTAAQIRSRQSTSGIADVFRIATLGWLDRRGQG